MRRLFEYLIWMLWNGTMYITMYNGVAYIDQEWYDKTMLMLRERLKENETRKDVFDRLDSYIHLCTGCEKIRIRSVDYEWDGKRYVYVGYLGKKRIEGTK